VLNFFAASAESNCSDDGENDSALHGIFSWCGRGLVIQMAGAMELASRLLNSWSAELHWRMRNFFTASAECDSRDDR
jgi:hypothetical protein